MIKEKLQGLKKKTLKTEPTPLNSSQQTEASAVKKNSLPDKPPASITAETVVPSIVLPVKEMHYEEDVNIQFQDDSDPKPAHSPSTAQAIDVKQNPVVKESRVADMIPVSVRVQSEGSQTLEVQRPGLVRELVMTAEGDYWSDVVYQLVESGRVQGLNRELALQSQLIGREPDSWILRVESENLNSSINREKLQTALNEFGYKVKLQFEIGVVKDSPARRNIAKNMAREKEYLERIQSDPFVQKMVQEFDAKIIMGSIKPIAEENLK